MNIPFHCDQLCWMVKLTSIRGEFLNPIFLFLNYFDTIYFSLFVIPFLAIAISYRWGLRIFYLIAVNSMINGWMKFLFGWPRPCTDMPEIGLLLPKSFGFPSGGAQTAFLLGAVLIYYWRTRTAWVVGIAYILTISFSRLYLAVHYPVDILGGWFFASILFFLFIKTRDRIEASLRGKGALAVVLIAIGLPLLLAGLAKEHKLQCEMIAVSAIAMSAYLSIHFQLTLPDPKSRQEILLRGVYIFLTVAFLVFCTHWLLCHITLAVAIWFSLLASPIFRAMTKK